MFPDIRPGVKRVLFIVPRFHTNMLGWVEVLRDAGWSPEVYVQYELPMENHSTLQPVKLPIVPGLVSCSSILRRVFAQKPPEDILRRLLVPNYASLIRHNILQGSAFTLIRREIPFSVLIANLFNRFLRERRIHVYSQEPLEHKPCAKSAKTLASESVETLRSSRSSWVSPVISLSPLTDKEFIEMSAKHAGRFVPFVVRGTGGRPSTAPVSGLNILGVGKMRPYKSWHTLIQAISLINPTAREKIQVRITGLAKSALEKEHFQDLLALARKLNVEQNFEFDLNVRPAEMRDRYQWADVLILPSLHETASIAVLEAMCWGVYPITTMFNGTNCYFHEGKSGSTFDPRSPKDLSRKIWNLAENLDLVPKLKSQAWECAQERLGSKSFLRAVETLFRAD